MRNILTALAFLFCGVMVFGQSEPSSALLKAAIIFRIIELDENLPKEGRELSIYVMGSSEIAKVLSDHIDHKIGDAKLVRVTAGNELPALKPDIMFVGISRNIEEILNYTRTNKVMSITDREDIFIKGVSVSVITGGKPRIMLNPQHSRQEGVVWDLDLNSFESLILEFKSND